MTKSINLKTIRVDGGTQSRVALNIDTVAEYGEALDEGDLPPVVVFFDGSENWLADGFHRYNAYLNKGRASITADVRTGTQRDAVLFSCGANAQHGLQRTNADKHRAVAILLADGEWTKLSDREIAKHCCVSHTYVSGLRHQKPLDPPKAPPETGNVASPKQKPPKPPPTENEANAEEAHGGTDLAELLQETQKELEAAQRQLAVASTDDLKAEALKWHRIADIATRRQNELQQAIVDREAEIKRHVNALRRIGRAVGEDDPAKVASMVEKFVRLAKVPA